MSCYMNDVKWIYQYAIEEVVSSVCHPSTREEKRRVNEGFSDPFPALCKKGCALSSVAHKC
jgi:hypothetical protein